MDPAFTVYFVAQICVDCWMPYTVHCIAILVKACLLFVILWMPVSLSIINAKSIIFHSYHTSVLYIFMDFMSDLHIFISIWWQIHKNFWFFFLWSLKFCPNSCKICHKNLAVPQLLFYTLTYTCDLVTGQLISCSTITNWSCRCCMAVLGTLRIFASIFFNRNLETVKVGVCI